MAVKTLTVDNESFDAINGDSNVSNNDKNGRARHLSFVPINSLLSAPNFNIKLITISIIMLIMSMLLVDAVIIDNIQPAGHNGEVESLRMPDANNIYDIIDQIDWATLLHPNGNTNNNNNGNSLDSSISNTKQEESTINQQRRAHSGSTMFVENAKSWPIVTSKMPRTRTPLLSVPFGRDQHVNNNRVLPIRVDESMSAQQQQKQSNAQQVARDDQTTSTTSGEWSTPIMETSDGVVNGKRHMGSAYRPFSNHYQLRAYTDPEMNYKRVEQTRWNKLRGMWGKRSTQFYPIDRMVLDNYPIRIAATM